MLQTTLRTRPGFLFLHPSFRMIRAFFAHAAKITFFFKYPAFPTSRLFIPSNLKIKTWQCQKSAAVMHGRKNTSLNRDPSLSNARAPHAMFLLANRNRFRPPTSDCKKCEHKVAFLLSCLIKIAIC